MTTRWNFIAGVMATLGGLCFWRKVSAEPEAQTESFGVGKCRQHLGIREPDTTLNRYQNKLCVITRSDGTHFGAVVQQSDRDTLYFNDLTDPLLR